MLIALDDPLWTRLYGPNGVQDVTGSLDALSRRWNEAEARELFRGRLYRQDNVYPVTFAALPWIWRIAPRPFEEPAETPLFLSHVLACAISSGGGGPRGQAPGPRGHRSRIGYRGLITHLGVHSWEWLPAEQRMRAEDLPVVKRLETWFTQTAPEIADTCVGLVSGSDPCRDANLLRGPAALAGRYFLPDALTMWGDEHDMQAILKEAPLEVEEDRSAALGLAAQVAPRSPDLARFLQNWAAA